MTRLLRFLVHDCRLLCLSFYQLLYSEYVRRNLYGLRRMSYVLFVHYSCAESTLRPTRDRSRSSNCTKYFLLSGRHGTRRTIVVGIVRSLPSLPGPGASTLASS
jgi:hypothetical protein